VCVVIGAQGKEFDRYRRLLMPQSQQIEQEEERVDIWNLHTQLPKRIFM
jgi:hypothetical protein